MAGSHRGRGARSRRLPLLLGSLAAVVVVVLVIVLVNVFNGGSGTSSVTAPPTSRTPLSDSTSPTPTPTPTTPSPTPTPVRTTPAPPAVATPAPGAFPVSVYNVSSVRGIAHLATARLEHVGYHVAHTANRTYRIATPVVYYDGGNASAAAAARGLVARHLGIDTAAVRPAGIPSNGGLIVIVTASYR